MKRMMSWRTIFAMALFGLAPVAAPAWAGEAPPVALLTDVEGRVRPVAPADAKALDLLSEVSVGQRLRLDGGARATAVYLDSGIEYELTGPAEVQFDATQPRSSDGRAVTKRGAALADRGAAVRISPVRVAQGAIIMRRINAGERLKLLSLSATTTLEQRPIFVWEPVGESLPFSFELLDATGRLLHQQTGTGARCSLPDGIELAPGHDYTWAVSTTRADGKVFANTGEFRIASADLRAQAESLRPVDDAPVSRWVAYAAWLEQEGLKDEARGWWKRVAAQRRSDARVNVLAND